MGHYTQVRSEFTLRADTPDKAIDALKWLFNITDRSEDWTECPHKDDHPFWALSRHHQIGENYCADTGWTRKVWEDTSLNLEGQTWTELTKLEDGTWKVVASSFCKNYDQQIQEFHKWIGQFTVNLEPHKVGVYRSEDLYSSGEIYSDGTVEYQADTDPDSHNYWR